MSSHFDTIVAPITGLARAAIAVIRLSGSDAWRIAGEVFQPWRPEHMRASYGRFSHGDDGLALPFTGGHSYTGDETVELSIHGSPASVKALVDACLAAGARMAEPGEFTLRAFMNGRIDLAQAEAVRDTVEARTAAQLRLANSLRAGSLSKKVEEIISRIGRAQSRVEATVDFSEEIGELDREDVARELEEIATCLIEVRESAAASRVLRSGIRVAIVGPPNAGKSSLLNAILGTDRAIVTEVPGTTRDFVEEQTELAGVPVVFIDTAGLRDSTDPVESLGIQRSRAVAANADVVWFVYDAALGWRADEFESATLVEATVVANKCDLTEPTVGQPVSALTGQGLSALLATLPTVDVSGREVALNPRQTTLIQEALTATQEAASLVREDLPLDLVTVLLSDAVAALGRITGRTVSPDMLERIFSDFCIGK